MWRATVKAGGGLTIGSDPAAEVREAKLKVGAFGSLVFMSTNWFLSPPYPCNRGKGGDSHPWRVDRVDPTPTLEIEAARILHVAFGKGAVRGGESCRQGEDAMN